MLTGLLPSQYSVTYCKLCAGLAGLLTAGSLWMLPKPCCGVTRQVTQQHGLGDKQQTQILRALQNLSQQLQLLEWLQCSPCGFSCITVALLSARNRGSTARC